jgi:hypothetical protein
MRFATGGIADGFSGEVKEYLLKNAKELSTEAA